MTQTHLVLDEHGAPQGTVDVDQIQIDAMILAFDLAAAAHTREAVENLLEQALTTHGPQGVGYVATAALKYLTLNVLSPVLQVTDELHQGGSLQHDLREGLAHAANDARESRR